MKKVNLSEVRELLKNQDTRLVKSRHSLVEVPFEDVLRLIEPAWLAEKYVDFYQSHPAFAEICAGARHHHWWRGGLEEHCKEICGWCFDQLDLYPGDYSGINRTDIIVASFLHDFAKVQTYIPITDEDRVKSPDKYLPRQEFKYAQGAFRIVDEESWTLLQLAAAGIAPTEKQWSAVLFSEGGFSDRIFAWGGPSRTGDTVFADNKLAVLVSMGDLFSSQVLGKSLYGVPEKALQEENTHVELTQTS